MGSLSFLHPALLWGLLSASLPIVIHLIGRRRAPTVRFAAFDFLMAVNKRLARREKLRQILLLLLRTLAVMVLAAALARPLNVRSHVASSVTRRLILIVDSSNSMNFRKDGKTLLEHAKTMALEALTHLQPGDSASLIVAGDTLQVPVAVPSPEISELKTAIANIASAQGKADIGQALEQGFKQLGPSGAGATIMILSDLAENSFAQVRPASIDPMPDVNLVDVAKRDKVLPLPNLSLEKLRIERTSESASERRFFVTIRNYGAQLEENRSVELSIDGVVKQRGFLDVAGRAEHEKVLTLNFDEPGIYAGEVRLGSAEGEGYTWDDRLTFQLEIAPEVRVLLVNGDPRTTPYEDELFFAEKALSVVPKGEPAIRMRIINDTELTDASGAIKLAEWDVVLLANVGDLPDKMLKDLVDFVRGGGGLLFSLGDKIKFENANARFKNLLAHPLRDRYRVADTNIGAPPIGMTGFDWQHPILQGLGLALEESLRTSRTTAYFNVDSGSALSARVPLRFENGAPAIIERNEGAGRVMLLTTSLDVDYSDFPLRSAYPALLQRAIRYLAKAVEFQPVFDLRQGANAELSVPTGATKVALVAPSSTRREVVLENPLDHRVVFNELTETGVYRAEVWRDSWVAEPRLNRVVNPSLEESDFTPIGADKLAQALGMKSPSALSFSLGTEANDPFVNRGFASYLLLALALLFVSENLLAAGG